MIADFVAGKSSLIKNALARPPRVEAMYHEMGFDVFLEYLDYVFEYPRMFAEGLMQALAKDFNELVL